MENKISEIIKTLFDEDESQEEEKEKKNKFLSDPEFCASIDHHEIFNGVENLSHNKEELYVHLFRYAIDIKNLEFLDYLIHKVTTTNTTHINFPDGILFEMYKINFLRSEQLIFIFEGKHNPLKISSNLIKILIQKNEFSLLNVLLRNLNYFDNETILKFCYDYQYQNPFPLLNYKIKFPRINLNLKSMLQRERVFTC